MAAAMLATPFLDAPSAHSGMSSDLAKLLPLLNRLRFLAQTCRSEAKLDLAQACSAIHVDAAKSLDGLATSLIRVISQAVEEPVIFLAPGARHMTFDEEWLLRVLDRAIARDGASVEFLLRRRVAGRNHYAFRSIVRAVGQVLA